MIPLALCVRVDTPTHLSTALKFQRPSARRRRALPVLRRRLCCVKSTQRCLCCINRATFSNAQASLDETFQGLEPAVKAKAVSQLSVKIE